MLDIINYLVTFIFNQLVNKETIENVICQQTEAGTSKVYNCFRGSRFLKFFIIVSS